VLYAWDGNGVEPQYESFVMKISADPFEKEGFDMLHNSNADKEVVCARILKVIDTNDEEHSLYNPGGRGSHAKAMGYLFAASNLRYFTAMEKADGTLTSLLPRPSGSGDPMTAFRIVYAMFQDIKNIYDSSRRDILQRAEVPGKLGIIMSDIKLDNFLFLNTVKNVNTVRNGKMFLPKKYMRLFPCDFGSFAEEWDVNQPPRVCSTEFRSPADDFLNVGIKADGYPDDTVDKTGGNYATVGHVAFCLGVTLMQLMDGSLPNTDPFCFYRRLPPDAAEVRPLTDESNPNSPRHPITDEQIIAYIRWTKYVEFTLNTMSLAKYGRRGGVTNPAFPHRFPLFDSRILRKLLNFTHHNRMVNGKPHPLNWVLPEATTAAGHAYGAALQENWNEFEDALEQYVSNPANQQYISSACRAAIAKIDDTWAGGKCASAHNNPEDLTMGLYRFCPPAYNNWFSSFEQLDKEFTNAFYSLKSSYKELSSKSAEDAGFSDLPPYPDYATLKRRSVYDGRPPAGEYEDDE
jgi:hypothetical protein